MNPTFIRALACLSLLLPILLPAVSRAASNDATDFALGPALEGEFALQEGDYARAAERYLHAAQLASDPALAERATEIALLTHQDARAVQALQRWRQLSPDSIDAASAGAVLAMRRGDRDQASKLLLAMLAGGSDGWKGAIRSLGAAADTRAAPLVAGDLFVRGHWPPDIRAWLAFGDMAQRLGDSVLFQRIATVVVARYPDDPRAWLLESARLREQGDTVGARRAIERALSTPHDNAEIRSAAAAELVLLADPKAAAAALAQGPQTIASYLMRAAILARADDRSGLLSLYLEIKSGLATGDKDGSAGDRQLLLGQLAEYLKREDEALAWYRAVPHGKSYAVAVSRQAAVLDRQGKTVEALALLHTMQANPGAAASDQRASYLLEAQLLAGHRRFEEALAVYARGLGMFDADPELLYGRALLLEQMDRVAESEAALRGILKIDPDNAEALNALGYTLADRTQRYREALGYIEQALRLQPDTPAFLDSLGWVQHRLGHDVDALRNLRQAFALQKDAEIAAHLGEVLWLGGDKQAARRIWKQGEALDKDNRAIKRVIETYHP